MKLKLILGNALVRGLLLLSVSTAALLVTIFPASAFIVFPTETWYLGTSATGSPITSYNFGSVADGSNPFVYLTLDLTPAYNVAGPFSESTTAPFSVGGVTYSNNCGLATTSCDITVQVFFNPQSPGPYSEYLDVNYSISSLDPTASIPLSGTGVVPLPATLPLFATGLGMLGLLGWRRKRKKAAAMAPT